MKAKPEFIIKIADDAKELTLEQISRIFFGMPFDDAVKAIVENKNGEYDRIYEHARQRKEQEKKALEAASCK